MKILHLSVSLDEKPLFTDVSLIIKPGELHCIHGHNGSGKSSLALTLMGHPLYTVTSGSIEIDGNDITAYAPHKRAQLGMYLALQYPPALPGITVTTFLREAYRAIHGSVDDMVAFSAIVSDALREVGLDESFAHRFVHDGFSGGEKKRFELAQIRVLKPRIIIFDEIDSGLDTQGIDYVKKSIAALRNENPQVMIICITHNAHLAKALTPDYVHTMCDGKLAPADRQKAA